MPRRVAWCIVWVVAYSLLLASWPLLRSQDAAKAPNTPRKIEPIGGPSHIDQKLLALPRDTTPTLSVTSLSTFVYQIGGAVPPAQTLTVTSSGNQVSLYAASYNYSWISVSPTTSVTPGQISVGVIPAGLAPNTYSGVVSIGSNDNVTNSPLSVPVSLVVSPAGAQLLADLVVSSFTAPTGGVLGTAMSGASSIVANNGTAAAPAFRIEYYLSQNANVTSSSIDTGSGCAVPGLAVGASFTCSISIDLPSGISPGVYYLAAIADPAGAVVESNKSNNILTSSAGPITLSPAPVNQAQLVVSSFLAPTTGVAGGTVSNVSVTILNNGTAAASAFRLEYYLSRNSAVTVSDIDTGWGCDVPGMAVNAGFECGGSLGYPGSLAAGVFYLAAIADSGHVVPQPNRTSNVRDNDNGPVTVTNPIAMSIAQGGIADPFTYTKGMAPGAWVSIYGSNLSASTQNWNPAPNQPIATTLGGVTVTINGIAAPISYVSPGQVNILVPAAVGEGPVSVVVADSVGAAGYTLLSTAYLPALYCNAAASAASARFYVTAVDPVTGEFVGNSSMDSRVVRPARPGETIDLYGSGLGPPLGSQFPTSTMFSTAYPLPLNFTIVLGGTPVTPIYAALIGPGLYQVRFTVPPSAGSGDLPIYLNFGSAQSSQSVYLTVSQ